MQRARIPYKIELTQNLNYNKKVTRTQLVTFSYIKMNPLKLLYTSYLTFTAKYITFRKLNYPIIPVGLSAHYPLTPENRHLVLLRNSIW